MATERVTIQVESNIGEDGPLTVMDTLHQFMDAFEFLSAAIADEPGGEKIRWRLESLTKNSPARAVGVAYSVDPAVVAAPLVHRGKQRASQALSDLADGRVAPWLRHDSHLAKSLFKRNLNGVGRTTFDLEEDAPRAVIVERSARAGLKAIEAFEAEKDGADRSRSEFGSIDAYVAEAKTYHGKPAIYVRERLSDRLIPCVLSDKLAQKVGGTHSWEDAWTGKRVRVRGEIFYDRHGTVSRLGASDLIDIQPREPDLKALQAANLTEGMSPVDYLDALWGYSE